VDLACKIERLIIAGDSLDNQKDSDGNDDSGAEGLRILDLFLHTMSQSLPVDLMPGMRDPTTVMLPQRPLHRAMFQHCAVPECAAFECRTNPFSYTLGDKLFLGTSGQNLDDLLRYFRDPDPLKLAGNALKWRHIAPTAPDTLCMHLIYKFILIANFTKDAYPFVENDPFLIQKCPDVYFVGNQPEFRTELVVGMFIQ
jgi:DNA polymerase delta subunit 2